MIYKNALSAGGVFSTTADLDKFSRMLFSSDENSLLSKESKENLLKGGFGLWTFSDENKKILDQSCHYMYGDIPGFHSVIAYYPESDLSLIMLTSRDGRPYKKIALDLARIAMNESVDSPGFSPSRKDLMENQKFSGKFFCDPVEYEFKVDEKSQLYLFAGGNDVKLIQTSPKRFCGMTKLEEYEFKITGNQVELEIRRNGNPPQIAKGQE